MIKFFYWQGSLFFLDTTKPRYAKVWVISPFSEDILKWGFLVLIGLKPHCDCELKSLQSMSSKNDMTAELKT